MHKPIEYRAENIDRMVLVSLSSLNWRSTRTVPFVAACFYWSPCRALIYFSWFTYSVFTFDIVDVLVCCHVEG